MIPDWLTTHLFLADRLAEVEPRLHADLLAVLHGVPISLIAGTADIWCRDYMPVQTEVDAFCQFVYRPDYLRGHEQLITPPETCRLPFMTNYRTEAIVLDGGNVVASRTKVILTDKVYKENPGIPRPGLRERLAKAFQAECIIIPKEPYDVIGHADGVVRFVAEDRVLMNDYSEIEPAYGAKVRKMLEDRGLTVESIPLVQCGQKKRAEIPSAVGIYINYLRVGQRIALPAYDRPEDRLALEAVQRALPDAEVLQLPCRSLAERGGVLNCILWTIKHGPASW